MDDYKYPESALKRRVVNVQGCARCGENHKNLLFKRFEREPIVDDDGTVWAYWGTCPTTGDPIPLRDIAGGAEPRRLTLVPQLMDAQDFGETINTVLDYLERGERGVPTALAVKLAEHLEAMLKVETGTTTLAATLRLRVAELERVAATQELRLDLALNLASVYAETDGAHHKQWCVDRMVRNLAGQHYDEFRSRYPDWDEGIMP